MAHMLCPSPLFQNRWCIDIRCKQWEQAYHGTLCIGYFMGAGLYKMAMAIDQRPVLRSTRIATYHVLDRCSSLPALTTRGVILCIERLMALPSSLTCIERQSGPIMVRCEYSRICCHSESKVAAIACLHGTMKTPVEWLCIEVL